MRDTIKKAMKHNGYTQEKLALKMGLARQSSLSSRLGHLDSAKHLKEIIEAMDCELVIRAKDGKEWRL